jgi:ubiquinone/menaquinone biosynthesis C-methylase UbiE
MASVPDDLRCPQHGTALTREAPVFRCEHGESYPVKDAVARLVWPPLDDDGDGRWNRVYDRVAPVYDWGERLGGRALGIRMQHEREALMELLGLVHGMRLLEVSPGPGVYQDLLAEKITPGGELVELDLSIAMLRACRRRAARHEVVPWLIQANGAHLPFADESFDAVFHFGGVKLFSEPARALDEFVRVARPGGLVAWGDEGFGAAAPTGWRRRVLQRMNPGYNEPVPPPPAGVEDVVQHEVMAGCGWLMVGRRSAVTSG